MSAMSYFKVSDGIQVLIIALITASVSLCLARARISSTN
jgi:hypothetical protein